MVALKKKLQCCATKNILGGMNAAGYMARAAVIKALASPVRLQIVDALKHGELCLCELQPLFTMNKSTLSRHVTALRQVGIVSERREGARVFLKLETPCILNVFDCAMRVIESKVERQAQAAGLSLSNHGVNEYE